MACRTGGQFRANTQMSGMKQRWARKGDLFISNAAQIPDHEPPVCPARSQHCLILRTPTNLHRLYGFVYRYHSQAHKNITHKLYITLSLEIICKPMQKLTSHCWESTMTATSLIRTSLTDGMSSSLQLAVLPSTVLIRIVSCSVKGQTWKTSSLWCSKM